MRRCFCRWCVAAKPEGASAPFFFGAIMRVLRCLIYIIGLSLFAAFLLHLPVLRSGEAHEETHFSLPDRS